MQVLILGFHRSHTSLFSNWLWLNGLFLGDKFLPASEHNQKGYYEDIEFLNIHLEILDENNFDKSAIFKSFPPKVSSNQKKSLIKLIDKRNMEHKVWGFKDPRSVLLVRNIYNSLLNEPYYITIVRPFKEAVNSIMEREFGVKRPTFKFLISNPKKFLLNYVIYPNKVLNAWINYNYELINLLEQKKESCLVIISSNLIRDQQAIITHLNKKNIVNDNINIKNIFDPKLTNGRDTPTYLYNPMLITKAKTLFKKFKSFYYSQQF